MYVLHGLAMFIISSNTGGIKDSVGEVMDHITNVCKKKLERKVFSHKRGVCFFTWADKPIVPRIDGICRSRMASNRPSIANVFSRRTSTTFRGSGHISESGEESADLSRTEDGCLGAWEELEGKSGL